MKQYIFIVILGLIIAGGCCQKAETSKQNNDIDRYCLALDLKPDSELIKEYRHMHSTKGMWPEIPAGIREAGCLDMEIYLIDNHMFMIVEVSKGADLDKIWEKMGSLDRQSEWAEFMLKFQQPLQGHGDSVKWILMEQVYDLDDHN